MLSEKEDDRVMAAKGYVYICMGEYEIAQQYLEQAAEKGNKEAEYNLSELRKYLNSL